MTRVSFKKKAGFVVTLLLTVFASIHASQASEVYCPDPSSIQYVGYHAPLCEYMGTTGGARSIALKGGIAGGHGCPKPQSFTFPRAQKNPLPLGLGCGYSSPNGTVKFIAFDSSAFNGCTPRDRSSVFDCNTTLQQKGRSQPRKGSQQKSTSPHR